MNQNEISVPKLVIIGDIAFDTKRSSGATHTDIGGGAYGSTIGALVYTQPVGIVSRVGTDFSASELQLPGLNTDGITVTPEKPTSHFMLTLHDNGQREVETVVELDQSADTTHFPHTYLGAEIIHLATSHPTKYLQWIEFLRQTTPESCIAVDAFETYANSFPNLTLQAMEQADLIFLNDEEMASLGRQNVLGLKKRTIIKHGAAGASYYDDKQELYVPAPKVEVVDTTGAGDVLSGALLAQIASAVSIEEALPASIFLASASVTRKGLKHLLVSPKNE